MSILKDNGLSDADYPVNQIACASPQPRLRNFHKVLSHQVGFQKNYLARNKLPSQPCEGAAQAFTRTSGNVPSPLAQVCAEPRFEMWRLEYAIFHFCMDRSTPSHCVQVHTAVQLQAQQVHSSPPKGLPPYSVTSMIFTPFLVLRSP
jgi:hypothetical protein